MPTVYLLALFLKGDILSGAKHDTIIEWPSSEDTLSFR